MTLGDGEPYSLGGAQSAAPHISKSPILLRHLFFDLYRIFLRTSALVIILSGQLSLFALKPCCKPMVVFIFCSQQDLCPIINCLNFVSQGTRIPLNQLFHKNMSPKIQVEFCTTPRSNGKAGWHQSARSHHLTE